MIKPKATSRIAYTYGRVSFVGSKTARTSHDSDSNQNAAPKSRNNQSAVSRPYGSIDGITWIHVGSDTITMASTIYVGLALTSHDAGSIATASFDNVSTTAGPPPSTPSLPSDWSNVDVGPAAVPGASSFNGGTFTVHGAGADIRGTADEFQFVYRTLTGDGAITARVATIEAVDVWTKAGVMVRASLTPQSRHTMMIVSSGRGLAFQRRVVNGAASIHTSKGVGTAPSWVKLERAADNLTASVSMMEWHGRS